MQHLLLRNQLFTHRIKAAATHAPTPVEITTETISERYKHHRAPASNGVTGCQPSDISVTECIAWCSFANQRMKNAGLNLR
jgi:hypothetical protein